MDLSNNTLAEMLNIAGDAMEEALVRYKGTSLLHPIKKFRRWRFYRRTNTVFEIALDLYDVAVRRRQRRVED